MLLGLLLTLNIVICLILVGVVLLQRSEGGALGTGGPTGLITTRGAGDLLTRTTWVLFTLFLVISLALTLLGGRERSSQAILNRLKGQSVNPDALALPTTPAAPNPAAPNPVETVPVLPPATLPLTGAPVAAPIRPQRAAAAPSPVLSAPLPTVRLPGAAAAPSTRAPSPAPVAAAPVAAPTPKIEVAPKPLDIPPPPAAAKEAAPQTPPPPATP
ncbi:MAG TPA: preprotein translocase subunit SecG [Caulobacteraceae bacterium]